jgi:hypothetical protein
MRTKSSCVAGWGSEYPRPKARQAYSPCPGKVGPLGYHGEAQLLLLLCGFRKGWWEGQTWIRVKWGLEGIQGF